MISKKLLCLVHTTQQHFTSRGDPPLLKLVGFDLHIEFIILNQTYPRFLPLFYIVGRCPGPSPEPRNSNQAAKFTKYTPQIGEEYACPAIVPNISRHNAGNDALHTICALAMLLLYKPLAEDLAQACHDHHVNQKWETPNTTLKR